MKPFQIFLILLLLAPHLFSNPGFMRTSVEKDWLITINDSSISDLSLEGVFLLNDSHQHVLSIDTNGQARPNGSIIKISYSNPKPGSSNLIYARAIVEIAYTPAFNSDAPMPSPTPNNWSSGLGSQAAALSKQTELQSIASLTEWVHKNVRYNIAYLGRNTTAEEVFLGREGVCTQYAILESAMLDSLGISSRIVSGYALQNGSYQPHAWLEVQTPSGMVPVDPTFGEAGALSPIHIGTIYGSADYADSLHYSYSQGKLPEANAVSLEVNFSAIPQGEKPFNQTANLSYSYDALAGGMNITIHNPTDSYLLFDYQFSAPTEIYGQEMRIVSLDPGEAKVFPYAIKKSSVSPGFAYKIPFIAQIPGAELNQTVTYSVSKKSPWENCAPQFLLPALAIAAALFLKSKIEN